MNVRLRIWLIAALAVYALYSVVPTIVYFSLPKNVRNDPVELSKRLPSWFPQKHVKLGLDLQGGVQLVLGVDTEVAIDNKLGRIGTEVVRWANSDKKQVKTAYALKGSQTLRIELEPEVDRGDFKIALKEEFAGLSQVDYEGTRIDFQYDDERMVTIRNAALEQAERVVRSRVDKWGVSEPSISRRADKSILVQLPGFKDTSKARELLGRTAQLKFKMVDEKFDGFNSLTSQLPEKVKFEKRGNGSAISFISEDKQAILDLVKGKIPEGRELLFEHVSIAGGKKTRYISHVLHAATEISGEDVLDAFVITDTSSLDNRPAVSLKFTGSGGKRFADVTGENINNRMAIVLDDIVVSDPVINTRISGGSAQITLGSGKAYNEIMEEANELSLVLKSGALPAPITILEERQVGATLGPELANQGVNSVIFGLVLVLVFMLFWYKRPGFISCVTLGLNAMFLLALMGWFGFSLTLPGFAGFILTLGMAVDANVLINERIRQELRNGKNAKNAVENGYKKVFWTIIDANVTTLIAALVLLETNSSGPIKGFAVALILGLLVSMFTSLYCSKMMFQFALGGNLSDKQVRTWLGGEAAVKGGKFSFDFLKFGKLAAITAIATSVLVVGLGVGKGLNWSVDFAGGTEIELTFAKPVETQQIRQILKDNGVPSATLQSAGSEANKRFLIRFEKVNNLENQKIRDALLSGLKPFSPDLLRVDYVGPLIGKEIRNQGLKSVIWAILGVLIYIGLRFDVRFAPGAVVKMVVDIFVIMGFYVLFYRSFDLTSIAALLTAVGYSVNDTIVIYDRIRQNLVEKPRLGMYETVNVSLNETLTRTINTSVTTILALFGILAFGSAQIWNFAAAMTAGVIAATLSSNFIASSFLIWFESVKKDSSSTKGQRRPAHT